MTEYYKERSGVLFNGEASQILSSLPSESVDCVITSPPYWQLRDYETSNQIGLEPTIEGYIDNLCNVFDEVKRVLKKSGSCWIVMGDVFSTQSGAMRYGHFGRKNSNSQKILQQRTKYPNKCLLQIPSRFGIEMINRGWILRNKIIWHKKNAMPEPVKDRFTSDYEEIFFLVKRQKYYFEQQFEPRTTSGHRIDGPVRNREYGYNSKFNKLHNKPYTVISSAGVNKNADCRNPKGRNKRCVWSINTQPCKEAHFAIFPQTLLHTPIMATTRTGDTILDPFMGSGTTAIVAKKLDRKWIGIEINREYCDIAINRIKAVPKCIDFKDKEAKCTK